MKYLNASFIGIILLAFVFVIADSLALSPARYTMGDFGDVNSIMNNIDAAKEEYNSNIDQVPGFVRSIFGNERINLTMDMEDGSMKHFSIETRRGYVETITEDLFDTYTMDVFLTESTANKIINSENQIKSLRQSLDSYEITYKPHRFKTFVKTFVSMLFISAPKIF